MTPGETIRSGASDICCVSKLPFEVLKSNAGWYIGTWCAVHGPYTRESGYYRTEQEAKAALDSGNVRWR